MTTEDVMKLALEIGFFALLGVLYYFWAKRRILKNEEAQPKEDEHSLS